MTPSHSDLAGIMPALLSRARKFSGFLALLCTNNILYLSGGDSLWKTMIPGNPELVARLDGPWLLNQAARLRHLRRLGRLEIRELLMLTSGTLLGSTQKRILHLPPGEEIFRTVFQVNDGGRPKGFVQTPMGHIFVGEYWGNPHRQSLRIWGSIDNGQTWHQAYTLPAGYAKHIHKLVWDPHRQGIWVLTGDLDGECALLFTGDEFKTVSEVVRGGQGFRACNIFCLPEGLYYGTDTEKEKNWVVFVDIKTGHLRRIFPLPGSCIFAAYMAGRYFISTNVEPSKVNHYKKAALWSSYSLEEWSKIIEFEKDFWPGEYLGFGSIILPSVEGTCRALVFSTAAVKKVDLTTFIINFEELENIN